MGTRHIFHSFLVCCLLAEVRVLHSADSDVRTDSACYASLTDPFLEPSCSSGLIAIQEVLAMAKPVSSGCIDPATGQASSAAGCCQYSEGDCGQTYVSVDIVSACTGNTSCRERVQRISTPPHCDPQTYYPETSYMVVNYLCVIDDLIAYPSNGISRTGDDLHLWNDNYASVQPDADIICAIESSCGSAIHLTAVDIRHVFTTPESGSGNACATSMLVVEGDETVSLPCSENGRTMYSLYNSSSNFIRLTLKASDNIAFWIRITVADEGASVSLRCGSPSHMTDKLQATKSCIAGGGLGGACQMTSECSADLSECIGGMCSCQEGYTRRNDYCHRDGSLMGSCSASSDCQDADTVCSSGQCVCREGSTAVGGSCYKPSLCSAVKQAQTGFCYSVFGEDFIDISCDQGLIAFEEVLAMAKPKSSGCPQVKTSLDTPGSCCQYEAGDCGRIYPGQFNDRFEGCSGQKTCIPTPVPWIETPNDCNATDYWERTSYVIVDYYCVPESNTMQVQDGVSRSSVDLCISGGQMWDGTSGGNTGNNGGSGGDGSGAGVGDGGGDGGGSSGDGGGDGGGEGGGNDGSGGDGGDGGDAGGGDDGGENGGGDGGDSSGVVTSRVLYCSVGASCGVPIVLTAIDVRYTWTDAGDCEQILLVNDSGQMTQIPCSQDIYTIYTMYVSTGNYIEFSLNNTNTAADWSYWLSISGANSQSRLQLICSSGPDHVTPTGSSCATACVGSAGDTGLLSMTCGENFMVRVNEISAFSKLRETGCPLVVDASSGTSELTSRCCTYKVDDCKSSSAELDAVFYASCMGNPNCSAQASSTSTSCGSNSYLSQTNYVMVDYTCVDEARIAIISDSGRIAGDVAADVYLKSDNYPDAMSRDQGGSGGRLCSVQASCETSISVTLLDLSLLKVESECRQKLYLIDNDREFPIGCDDSGFNTEVYQSNGSYLQVRFDNSLDTDGGRFWLAFRGEHHNSSVTLTCKTSAYEDPVQPPPCDGSVVMVTPPPTGASTASSSTDSAPGTTEAVQGPDRVTLLAVVLSLSLVLLLGLILALIFWCRHRCVKACCPKKKPLSVNPSTEFLDKPDLLPAAPGGLPPISTVFKEDSPVSERRRETTAAVIPRPARLPPLKKRATLTDLLYKESDTRQLQRSKSFHSSRKKNSLTQEDEFSGEKESKRHRSKKKHRKALRQAQMAAFAAARLMMPSNSRFQRNYKIGVKEDSIGPLPGQMPPGGRYSNIPPAHFGQNIPVDRSGVSSRYSESPQVRENPLAWPVGGSNFSDFSQRAPLAHASPAPAMALSYRPVVTPDTPSSPEFRLSSFRQTSSESSHPSRLPPLTSLGTMTSTSHGGQGNLNEPDYNKSQMSSKQRIRKSLNKARLVTAVASYPSVMKRKAKLECFNVESQDCNDMEEFEVTH